MAELHCCGICAKVILVFSNIIYMLISVGIVGFGTFFLVHHADIELFTGDETISWFVGFILVGVAMFLIGLLGVISCVTGNHKLLIAYMVATLSLILVVLIGTGLSLFSNERNSKRIGDQFMKFINRYTPLVNCSSSCSDDDTNIREAVDIVQEDLKCCGLYGPSDWYNTSYGIPVSCTCEFNTVAKDCRALTDMEHSLLIEATVNNGIWKQGCNDTLEILVGVHFILLGGFSFFLAVCELSTLIVTTCLIICVLRARKHQRRIDQLQSVAYTPLDSYPANTLSNNQFVPGGDEEDEDMLSDGQIVIQ